jgi:hypothetical protein
VKTEKPVGKEDDLKMPAADFDQIMGASSMTYAMTSRSIQASCRRGSGNTLT